MLDDRCIAYLVNDGLEEILNMEKKRYSKMMNHYGTSRTYCTGIYDNQNNRELQNSNQVIAELNALHKENEQLKRKMKD